MAKRKSDDELLDDVDGLSSSAYLNAKDVKDGDLTFEIEAAAIEAFEGKDGKKSDRRLVLVLEGDPPRKLSLNETNRTTFKEAWGKSARRWVGQVFDAYFDPTVRNPSGAKTGGLRVRVRSAITSAKPNGSGVDTTTTTEPDAADDSIRF